jgi:demethylmenaquinone methyltransferase / 2-methoxy-6-polyprenyl-1,4-benzoquinol methylase
VIDLCTGTGDLLLEFAIKEEVAHVTGVDFTGPMLIRAQEKAGARGLAHKVTLVRADVFDAALEKKVFDAVSMAFGLRNLPDSAQAVARMAEFARPGGYVAVLELCPIKNRGLSLAHRIYTGSVVPWWGGLLSGASQEYRYLSSSIQGFLYPEEVMGLMQGAGLACLRMIKLAGGVAAIFIGRKQ